MFKVKVLSKDDVVRVLVLEQVISVVEPAIKKSRKFTEKL